MEDKLVKILAEKYEKKGCLTVEELVIPRQLHSKAFKKNSKRSYRRIDLAVYDPEKKLIIFIEAENGLWMQHPVAYKELANYTYLVSPVEEKKREYNGEQKTWAKKEGIGIIEINLLTEEVKETVSPQFNELEKSIIELIYIRMAKAKNNRK